MDRRRTESLQHEPSARRVVAAPPIARAGDFIEYFGSQASANSSHINTLALNSATRFSASDRLRGFRSTLSSLFIQVHP